MLIVFLSGHIFLTVGCGGEDTDRKPDNGTEVGGVFLCLNALSAFLRVFGSAVDYGSGLPYKKGMAALFVRAAVVGGMLIIVMQKGSLSAHRARRMFPPTNFPLRPRSFGCKLMTAVSAEILLVTI